MGSVIIPAAAGGGIKSVQRGTSVSAGNTTITAVDMTKSYVTTFPTGSSGSVNTGVGSWNGQNQMTSFYASSFDFTTSFAAKTYGAYLSSSTVVTTTGPCRWEVVEFA